MAGKGCELWCTELEVKHTDLSYQIAYTAIVGAIMCAAFLEWFLWVAAFLYCLVKVFQKAEHWTVKLLASIVAILFTLLRYVKC